MPSCANSAFLNGVLRESWGFEGMVVSDCGAIDDIQQTHAYTDNWNDTVAAAVTAGTDLECDDAYRNHLMEALAAGAVREAQIDVSVARLLTHFLTHLQLRPSHSVTAPGMSGQAQSLGPGSRPHLSLVDADGIVLGDGVGEAELGAGVGDADLLRQTSRITY